MRLPADISAGVVPLQFKILYRNHTISILNPCLIWTSRTRNSRRVRCTVLPFFPNFAFELRVRTQESEELTHETQQRNTMCYLQSVSSIQLKGKAISVLGRGGP
jgi:hypothetical protein